MAGNPSRLTRQLGPSLLGAGEDDEEAVSAARRYLQQLYATGWSVPTWPIHAGGRFPWELEIFLEEARAARPVGLYPFATALFLIGPTLLEWANQEQQDRWLQPIAAGEAIWCQLFSEPDAGSDLAGVKMTAVSSSDGWVVNGQKVWSSRASYADLGLLLTNSSKTKEGQRSLTVFVLEMDSPGVTVRHIRQMNGDSHFCEVFLDDVLIPDINRIGEIGEGWAIAKSVLARERIGDPVLSPVSPRAVLDDVITLARKHSRDTDSVMRDRLARAYVQARISGMVARWKGRPIGSLPSTGGSGAKLRWSNSIKEIVEIAMELLGPSGVIWSDVDTWQTLCATVPSLSIRGGSDEIQRNIIAERVLGLPRDDVS